MNLERQDLEKIKEALRKINDAGKKLGNFYEQNSNTFTYKDAFLANQLAKELGNAVSKYETLLGRINKLPRR